MGHGLIGDILHGLLGDVLELLRQRAPPLHGVRDGRCSGAGLLGLLSLFFGRLGRLRSSCRRRGCRAGCGLWRRPGVCTRSHRRAGCARLLHLRSRRLGKLLPALDHGAGPVLHRHIHGLQRRQGHFLHFHRLNGGRQGPLVLLQPEQHGLELIDAFFQILHVHRGGYPFLPLPHSRGRFGGTARSELLQKVKAGGKGVERLGGVLHGDVSRGWADRRIWHASVYAAQLSGLCSLCLCDKSEGQRTSTCSTMPL